MKGHLLIDGNNIGYIAQDSNKLHVGGEEIQAVFGFLRILQRILREHVGMVPTVLWDGHAQWRYDLFPQYKSRRDDDPVREAERIAYRKQRPKIMQALTMLGVRQITDPNAEADDLAGYLSRNLSDVKLITGDMDWLQLVSKSTSWHCYKSKRDCSHLNFEEFTGFKTPKLFLEGKCLVGDNSDSIPGVGGIGKDSVVGFLNTWGSVQGFFDAVDSDPSIKLSKVHRSFADNLAPTKVSSKYGQLIPMRDAYARNVQLMDLSLYSPKKSSLVIDNGQLDLQLFKEFCQDHSFRTILATLETWATPFKNLKG